VRRDPESKIEQVPCSTCSSADSLTNVTSVIALVATGSSLQSTPAPHQPPTLEPSMREFADADGRSWSATAATEETPDYKGRYHLVMEAEDGQRVELTDIRWNSERSAVRTIDSMSVVELRRRLRSATGRGTAGV